jgi:hypothetical protein
MTTEPKVFLTGLCTKEAYQHLDLEKLFVSTIFTAIKYLQMGSKHTL